MNAANMTIRCGFMHALGISPTLQPKVRGVFGGVKGQRLILALALQRLDLATHFFLIWRLKMNRNANRGFTLIELMIVVAIVGILAAVGLPAYQDYTTRAKITEGISLVQGAKTSISEIYQATGSYPSNNAAAFMGATTDFATTEIKTIANSSGTVTITFNAFGGVDEDDTLRFVPSNTDGVGITWSCDALGSIEAKYLPTPCTAGTAP